MSSASTGAGRPIALLITELAYGGTPRSVQQLAVGLRRGGFDVRVASLMAKVDIAFDLERLGIAVTGFDIEHRGLLAASRDLFVFLRRERVGLLHTFNFHANLLGRTIGRAAGVPVIVSSERSVESAKARSRVWCDRLTWWFASQWTTNAEAAAAVLTARERIPRSRITVIPSGVDINVFAPRPSDLSFRARCGVGPERLLLVCVGRLDRYKGQDCLLEAFGRIVKSRPDVHLALVGDGRRRQALEATVAEMGLASHVVFTGALDDVRPALAAADLFVLASEEEGMPSSVLEAMAMGVPVVASAVGGTPELVVDGATGVLVPPRQSGPLEDAIRTLIDSPELRRNLGEAGRRRIVERFSIERTIGLSEQIYGQLVPSSGVQLERTRTAPKPS